MTRTLAPLVVLLAAACAGPAEQTTPTDTEPGATAGGEAETAETEPAPLMRTTIPVPVPQPAVAREELSEPLQQVWTSVEEVVAIRPPDVPEEDSQDAVQEWSSGPFREWIDTRAEAMRGLMQSSRDVPEQPAWERAVASALIGYSLEDFVADVRGAPVPSSIAQDPRMLQVYVDNLDEILRPMATEAVVSYAYCQQALAGLGDDSAWLPWRAYCVQRGQDVIDTYRLQPPGQEQEAGETAGEPQEGEPQEDEPEQAGEEATEPEPAAEPTS